MPEQPLAMDAVAGAIDSKTRDTVMRLYQVERLGAKHATNPVSKARVAPEPAEMERIAGNDSKCGGRGPVARQQCHLEPFGLQRRRQTLHVTFGTAEGAVPLTQQGDTERP